MSDPAPHRIPAFWPAWAFWSVAQLAVLALFAARTPIAAKIPAPIEQYAGAGVATTQLIVAALLGPALLGSNAALACSVATALPVFVISTLVSGHEMSRIAGVSVLLAAWLGSFGLFLRLLRHFPVVAHAVLVALCAGLPAVHYLGAEFGPGSPHSLPHSFEWISPVMGVCSTLFHGSNPVPLLALPAVTSTILLGYFSLAQRSRV